MKRRKFLRTAGVASVALSAGSLMAFNRFPAAEDRKLTPEEMQTVLDTYFADLMNGKYFNPNILPVNEKLFIVKSYSVDIIKERNTIFDVADIVIERLKRTGFNASSLKKGIIPEELTVGAGFVRPANHAFGTPIDELKNYDAILSLHEYSVIKSNKLPSTWINIVSFTKEQLSNGAEIYKGEGFRLAVHNRKQSKDLELKLNVIINNSLPQIEEFIPEMVNSKFISTFFSNDQLNLIKI